MTSNTKVTQDKPFYVEYEPVNDKKYHSSLTFSYYDSEKFADVTIKKHLLHYNSFVEVLAEIESVVEFGKVFDIRINARGE